jgi:hypothetical protein
MSHFELENAELTLAKCDNLVGQKSFYADPKSKNALKGV